MKSISKWNGWRQFAQTLSRVTSLAVLMASVSPVNASAERHPILSEAEDYLRSQILLSQNSEAQDVEVKAAALDPRIRVPTCPLPLRFQANNNQLKQSVVSVKASCDSSDWYLYLTLKVSRTQTVVVLADMVSPGTLLTSDNLELMKIDVNRLRGSTYNDVESIVGARVKRRLRAGQPIAPNMLCYVCKGDNIVISASVGGLQIKTAGIAQQDGNLGDTIRVQNTSSRKTINARVASLGTVNVNI